MQILGTVDYSLQSMLQLEMIGLFNVNIDTPNGAASIKSTGDLKLVQSTPTHIDSVKRTLYNVNPFDSYGTYSLQDILEQYYFRTGKFTFKSDFIERTVYDQQSILVKPLGSANKVAIDITVRVPSNQRIRYVPGILETLKYAWIQYLAIFLPALYFFKVFVGFMFKYRVLEANIVADLSNKRII